MLRKVLLLLFGVLSFLYSSSQELITYSGVVSDAETTEKLIGASIYTADYRYHSVTNTFGAFQINVPKHYTYLLTSYIGYRQDTINLEGTMDISLVPDNRLDSIVIQAPIIRQKQEIIGKISMPISVASRMPQLFGTTDIMKSLALYPGIQTGLEGTSGLYVRGGGPGQNLILLDENKVYNNSHLFGFSSVFNPNVVKSVDLYKSGFPAQYGNRLSSVLSINTIDGNSVKAETKISVGLLESGIVTQGPIKSLNATYVLAGRAFYLGAFTLPNLVRYNNGRIDNYVNYFFHDLNGKVKFRLDRNQTLSLSYFGGNDTYTIRNRSDNEYAFRSNAQWGSQLLNLRYSNHFFKRHFFNINLLRNSYLYSLANNVVTDYAVGDFDNTSFIKEYELNVKAQYRPVSSIMVDYGASISAPKYSPFHIKTKIVLDESIEKLEKSIEDTYLQHSYFVDIEYKNINGLSLRLGNRIDNYNIPSLSSLYYSPRAKIEYAGKTYKLSLTYDKTVQFEQLLSGNNGGVPSDIFVPSSEDILPQVSQQLALGYFKNFSQSNLSINGDVFYRFLENQIVYLPEFYDQYLSNSKYQDELITGGKGTVYGFEMFLRREMVRLQYALSYTYMHNTRQFSDFNDGKSFNASFARRNDFQFNINYIFTKKISLNLNFVYSSGHYITLPNKVYSSQTGYATGIISEWNSVKTRDYNRADIGLTYKYKKRKRDVIWKFGIYNFYAYQNPMFYEYSAVGFFREENGVPMPIESKSVIYGESNFIFIPSITYETKF